MNWHLKVAGYKLLSVLPGGRTLYGFSQKHITKSLTPSRARLTQKIEVAVRYLHWLAEHHESERLLKGVHLDFGSGWHPTIPLFLYSIGVERQYLFDVVPVLDSDMLGQTVKGFLSIVGEPGFPHQDLVRRMPPAFDARSWEGYLRGLGLSYHAPYVEEVPSLADSVEVATCTQVLPYVRADVVPWCFGQVHQCLKSGGLFLATVHLRDVVAGVFQPGLVKYNQLRYSPKTWERWVLSPLMSFNRLKAPDYRQLLEAAGFEIVHFEIEPGTAEELKELEQVRIAECFRGYKPEDLAARHLFFVARKR
jgi:hypothetical protein